MMNSNDVEPKVRLFFKLIQKNHGLLTHLISQYSNVQNPATKKCILKHYTQALKKGKVSLEHDLLVSLVTSAPTDSLLLVDTLSIVKDLLATMSQGIAPQSPVADTPAMLVDDLKQACEKIKAFAVLRMKDEKVVSWVGLLGPLLNMVGDM